MAFHIGDDVNVLGPFWACAHEKTPSRSQEGAHSQSICAVSVLFKIQATLLRSTIIMLTALRVGGEATLPAYTPKCNLFPIALRLH